MDAIFQFIIRQSGFLAFLMLLFALANGWYVGEGLWQGSGLHGYTDDMNNKYGFFIVWTWDAFIRMLICLGLAMLFGLIPLRKNGASPNDERAGGVKSPQPAKCPSDEKEASETLA